MTIPGPFTMSQQAQNDFYETDEELALDYAAAVNEEIKDLFVAGADVVQIDEPYMQARAETARRYGLQAVARALDGVEGTTALHICFGYAAIIHERPEGYSFLPELADTRLDQISIETAQSNLDTSVLTSLPGKTIILGVLDLSDATVDAPEAVAQRIRRALAHVPADRIVAAPDCGLKYLPRDVAFGKMTSLVEGASIVRARAGSGSGVGPSPQPSSTHQARRPRRACRPLAPKCALHAPFLARPCHSSHGEPAASARVAAGRGRRRRPAIASARCLTPCPGESDGSPKTSRRAGCRSTWTRPSPGCCWTRSTRRCAHPCTNGGSRAAA